MSDMRRLGTLLSESNAGGIAGKLRHAVLATTSWLHTQANGPVALYLADSTLFATWLLACWQAGRSVILPGDATVATERYLTECASLLIGDFAQATCRTIPSGLKPAVPKVVPDGQLAVEVFTSGSTGVPVRIAKALRQLDAEVQILEQVLGPDLPRDLPFLATVSHQHLYGLLFGVLWPLARGQHALACSLTYPEELRAHANPYALISSPAFLKRLPQELDWPHPSLCRLAISSGGALPASAAQLARRCLDTGVTEIYGSTETGGIARRVHPDASWTLQPGVRVRLEASGCLAVRSPMLPDADWFVTADRATLTESGFELAGRDDRIVKIEEKRISLTALEHALTAHDWVDEARVIPLEEARTVLGAVLVLSASGQAALAQAGKLALTRTLRATLADAFERVALPRRWRFVDQLPLNSMGKTPHALLARLFMSQPHLPAVLEQIPTESGLRLTLELSPELAVFEGHFPDFPILPGVAQLEWAVHFAHERLGTPSGFMGMEAIKFQKIAYPGSRIDLELAYQPEKQALQFSYQSASGVHSSGRIRLGTDAA